MFNVTWVGLVTPTVVEGNVAAPVRLSAAGACELPVTLPLTVPPGDAVTCTSDVC